MPSHLYLHRVDTVEIDAAFYIFSGLHEGMHIFLRYDMNTRFLYFIKIINIFSSFISQELGELGQLLSYLNEDLATGLAPLIIIDGIYASGAITHLIQHGKHIPVSSLIMLVVAVMLWVFIIVFPLSQVSLLNLSCIHFLAKINGVVLWMLI